MKTSSYIKTLALSLSVIIVLLCAASTICFASGTETEKKATTVAFCADEKVSTDNSRPEICKTCNGNGYTVTTFCTKDFSENSAQTVTTEAYECPVPNCNHGIIE